MIQVLSSHSRCVLQVVASTAATTATALQLNISSTGAGSNLLFLVKIWNEMFLEILDFLSIFLEKIFRFLYQSHGAHPNACSGWMSEDEVLAIITHSILPLGVCHERAKG